MATRIKDWEVPYIWWIGIEITNNHVINVLLRELNNLIHVNEDRELYVDLQIPDGVEPDYDFEVGVTTWRILQEDWRPQNWLIINRKTTSWDYTRLITAADGKFYVDLGDWIWRLLWGGWGGWGDLDCNTKTFYLPMDTTNLTVAQEAYDWYKEWKNAILWYDDHMYVFYEDNNGSNKYLTFISTEVVGTAWESSWVAQFWWDKLILHLDSQREDVTEITFELHSVSPTGYQFLPTNTTLTNPFNPTEDSHPTTKKYVDDGLALKQDKLTAGQYITIDQNNVISATMPSALIYKWNVNDVTDLPSSWQTVWDTYFVEWADAMYSWDWTQWNYVWGTWISLNDYFNMTINNTDDITEGSTNLFCTSIEKSYWNSKQDQLTAWTNIQINNNVISATDTTYSAWDWIDITNTVISNTAKFDPENWWSLWQFLKKTSTGYAWANVPWGSGETYTAWDGIDITNNVISATDRFTPTNQWSTWQVLKKSGANSYYWANEGWWGWGWETYYAWDWIEITDENVINNTKQFNPWSWTAGQVLTKTANGYDWETITAWEWNVKLFTLSSTSDTTTAEAALSWFNSGKMPILEYEWSFGATSKQWKYFFYPIVDSTSTSTNLIFENIPSSNQYYIDTTKGYTQCKRVHVIFTVSGTSVTNISIWESIEAKNSFISPDTDYANLWNVFTPARDWDPATKKYVDSRNWVGTQAEYNQLTPITWVIYNII